MKKNLALFFAWLLCLVAVNSFGQYCGATNGWSGVIPLGTTKTYSVPPGSSSTTTYDWSVSGGLVIVAGLGTPTVTVKGNVAGSGKLHVTRLTNGVDICSDDKVITITSVSILATPAISRIIIEPCETVGIYASAVNGADGYNFLIDGNLYYSGSERVIFIDLAVPEITTGSHTVCVSAYNSITTSSQKCKSFVVNCIGGGSQRLNAASVSPAGIAYPNPARGQLTISEISGTVKMYNSQGTEVLSSDIKESDQIDVSYLNQGVYYLILISDEGIRKQTVLIE